MKHEPKRVGGLSACRYTVPRPGTDNIIDDIKSLKFAITFDKKIGFQKAIVKFDGSTSSQKGSRVHQCDSVSG